jgi:hypothetical protein
MRHLLQHHNALKAILVIAILGAGGFGYFLFNNPHPTAPEPGWQAYHNADLGVSFLYPSSYHVYQPDANYLRIDSDYTDPASPYTSLSLSIRRYNTQPPTLDTIKAEGRDYTSTTQASYQVIHTYNSLGQWLVYILSDKGTYSFSDTLDVTPQFISYLKDKDAYYQYRQVFEHVVSTFRFD